MSAGMAVSAAFTHQHFSLTRHVAFVKMDVEGFEWQILRDLLLAPARLKPEQVAVEVHLQTQMSQLPWWGRYKAPAEVLALGQARRDPAPRCGRDGPVSFRARV